MEDAKVGAFFSRLDYEIPELARVRDAEAHGDRRAAEEAFLRYCRERPQPNLAVRYVSAHTERGFAQNTTGYDFISERYVEEFPDHHVTWRDRARMRPLIGTEPGYTWSRTQGIKQSAYTLIDIADLVGLERLAQVDLGVRVHRNRPLDELSVQAMETHHAALHRSDIEWRPEWSHHLLRPDLAPVEAQVDERPPLNTVAAYLDQRTAS